MKTGVCGAMLLAGSLWAAEPPVQICLGDGNEWAPFTYWERSNGEPDRTRLTGIASGLVLEALRQSGFDYRISYLPWARVQQELKEFARNRECELTWDASYKAERAEFALYSVPLYQTRLGLFYLGRRFPEGPDMQTVQRSRVCGVVGYNYTPYELQQEVRLVRQIQQVLDMMERERCDFFPSEIEPLLGGLQLGIYHSQGELQTLAIPRSKRFYLLVSKGSPRADALLSRLNQALIRFDEEGYSATLFRRFLPKAQP